jgi:MOSC domain-containing protein YiiM
MKQGRVISLHIAPRAGVPMNTLEEAQAVRGVGLAGDRYAGRLGTYSKTHGPDREITLLALETLAAVKAETGIDLLPAESRRNVITEGAELETLAGKTFRVGGVLLRGIRPCEPCGYLERLTGKAVHEPLKGRGGLRAEVLSSGMLRRGDVVEALTEAEISVLLLARR